MANRQSSVHVFPSTTWEYRKVRVRRVPAPAGDSRLAETSDRSLRARDAHKGMTVVVKYRGGPTASWLIEYRGKVWRFDGALAVHDVLSSLFSPHGKDGRNPLSIETR